jgi:hypothetical protein
MFERDRLDRQRIFRRADWRTYNRPPDPTDGTSPCSVEVLDYPRGPHRPDPARWSLETGKSSVGSDYSFAQTLRSRRDFPRTAVACRAASRSPRVMPRVVGGRHHVAVGAIARDQQPAREPFLQGGPARCKRLPTSRRSIFALIR